MLGIAAFMGLLMLLEFATSAQPAVPPPTNLTVSCHNTAPSAHWRFDEDNEVHFLVNVGSSDRRHLQDVTAQRSYRNLSALVWESLESVMDVHYVSVAAVTRDGRLSNIASTTFTYNIVKMANVMCKLDFPPADVTANEGSVTVSFRNPLRYYPQLRRATTWDQVFVDITATSDGGVVLGSCRPDENVCKMDVVFPAGFAECVTLTGSLRDFVERTVVFRESPRICVETSSAHVLMLGLQLGIAAAVLLVCVAVVIWKVRAWSVKATKAHLPECLFLKADFAAHSADVKSGGGGKKGASCCAVNAEAGRDVQRFRLIYQGDDDFSGVATVMESLPVHQEEEVEEEGQGAEEEGQGWHVDEDFVSNYDCQHVNMPVYFGGGESVWGYTAR
ncbi:interferon gamma receptor 1 isoform X2 [Phyllopteryx taeniolatus]|uniref:interferon gamma receptor 1 isoform X2 n=1 Tax=Phyllopteryx taeniolatus TaxID=161469 RepID=UPI002AD1DB89|nr:interferon gamma receptor 1 isoform X2 [Phyllopteryx taeniolatus]